MYQHSQRESIYCYCIRGPHVTDSTMRSYLSAIRHMHLAQGFQDPLKNAQRLALDLKGHAATNLCGEKGRSHQDGGVHKHHEGHEGDPHQMVCTKYRVE